MFYIALLSVIDSVHVIRFDKKLSLVV